jgi:hypothetical protein
MDDLTLLARMREEVPPDTRYPVAHRALLAEISGAEPARARRNRRPILISGLVAGTVAAGAIAVAITSSGDSGGEHRAPPIRSTTAPPLRLVAVTSPMALAANAATVARRAVVPAPTQWVYVKMESTISHAPPSGAMAQVPGSHQITESWTRVDMLYIASVRHGRTVVTSTNGGMGNPVGWPAISYAYLNALPTDPDALLKLMRHNMSAYPGLYGGRPTDDDVFDSVIALMENYTVLPARLNATLYGVLARLKVVHLQRARDIADRRVLSLYRVQDGMKTAIFIDPATYAYAGQIRIMVADHTLRALDGSRTLHKGELLDDEAILVSKIVNSPGARS